jgi:hypothetical protein
VKRTNYDKKEGYQSVVNYKHNNYIYVKSIVRTNCLIDFDIHSSKTTRTTISPDNKQDFTPNYAFSRIDETILENSYLHLNHYAIQSFQWFMKIKATRGDVAHPHNDTVRNKEYFYNYDTASNDIIDLDLSTLKTLCIVACHTSSDLKIQSLKKSKPFLEEISDDIIYINSSEFEAIPIFDMSYVPNDNHVCYGKYVKVLSTIDLEKYDNYILTNDSILILHSLRKFKTLFDPMVEMTALVASNEDTFHFPDALRRYNKTGIQKIIELYKESLQTQSFNQLINDIELKCHSIHSSINVLYPVEQGYMYNIHFDNHKIQTYLENEYPVVKIKKIILNDSLFLLDYLNTFHWIKYLNYYPDLRKHGVLTRKDAIWHWFYHGKQEGRTYFTN